jgi:hypothetical protein
VSEWREKQPMQVEGVQCRVFQRGVEDGHLSVIVGQEPHGPRGQLFWHLSISHRSNVLAGPSGGPAPGRLPLWDEIKEARYRFCPNEVYMAQILPPKEEFVNFHPTTMHLYEIPKWRTA